jgi:galactose mutarotase-like enzyme
LPWTATEQNTQNKASVTVVLNSNEETKAVYPFDFQLAFTYELQGNTLAVRQEYKNLSSTPMPFSAGFHPYFLCGDKNQLEVELPSGEYQDNKTKEFNAFNGKFDFNQDEIDFAFGGLTAQSASVTDNSRKFKLTLDYDDFTTWLVFWDCEGQRFLLSRALERHRNAFNTAENLTVLAPGSSCTAAFQLTANFF